jgi:hypothetical protein
MPIANTVIQIKKSTATGNVPASLANGELAINAADGKLFYKDTTGTIKNITNQLTFGTVNSNGSLIIASTTTDTLSIIPGNNVTITTDTILKTITINSSAAGGSGGSSSGYLANAVIIANSTGYLTNVTNLLYYSSNDTTVYTGTINVSNIILDSNGTFQLGPVNFLEAYNDAQNGPYVLNRARISVNPTFGWANNGGIFSSDFLRWNKIVSTTQFFPGAVNGQLDQANSPLSIVASNNYTTGIGIFPASVYNQWSGQKFYEGQVIISSGSRSGSTANLISNYIMVGPNAGGGPTDPLITLKTNTSTSTTVGVYISGNKPSNTSTTGSLVVSGGVGISGNLSLSSSGNIIFGDGTRQNSAAQITPNTSFDGVYDLDDLSYVTDGLTNIFTLTYNSSNVTVISPSQIQVSVDGAMQPNFVYNSDTVWLSQVFGGYKGYTIDYQGQLRFSDAPPSGAQIVARTVVGAITTTKKVYPFSPIDIMVGY